MRLSFSHTLLITWFFLFWGCKTLYIHSHTENRNLIVSDSIIAVDSQLVNLYLPYKQMLDKDMSQVISVSAEEMVKNKPESKLTNFLADLLLYEGKQLSGDMKTGFEPDIAFFNYGGIRTFLPQGEITVGKIYELMPFENELVFIRINGRQVQEFLNIVAEKGGEGLGGVRFTISENRATRVRVGGQRLRNDENYWLVTSDYVAAGGDGMGVFTQTSEFVPGNKKIRDVIIEHLKKKHAENQVIAAEKDGRISYE